MGLQDLTIAERAYLAGFIDGEGCIHISRTDRSKSGRSMEHKLELVITQNVYQYLQAWRDKVGAGFVYRNMRADKTGEGRHCGSSQWRIADRQAVQLLESVYEFLILKRREADIAFAFMATKGHTGQMGQPRRADAHLIAQREQMRAELMNLNSSPHDAPLPVIEACPELENQPDLFTIPDAR